jgi:hypothetical protein
MIKTAARPARARRLLKRRKFLMSKLTKVHLMESDTLFMVKPMNILK